MGKRLKPEEIISKLREVEVRLARGETAAQAARSSDVTEQAYFRWCKRAAGWSGQGDEGDREGECPVTARRL